MNEKRLREALEYTRTMILQLPSGIDQEADENDRSPRDAVAHLGGLIFQKVEAALAASEPRPIERPYRLTAAEKYEVAGILLNMICYKHGPASAREWVDGVISAIAVWKQAKLDDPNYYDANPDSKNNRAEPRQAVETSAPDLRQALRTAIRIAEAMVYCCGHPRGGCPNHCDLLVKIIDMRELLKPSLTEPATPKPGPTQTCSKCGGKTWFTANGLCEKCSPDVNAASSATP